MKVGFLCAIAALARFWTNLWKSMRSHWVRSIALADLTSRRPRCRLQMLGSVGKSLPPPRIVMRLSIPDQGASRAPGLTVLIGVILFAPPGVLVVLALTAGDPARWRLVGGAFVAVVIALTLLRHVGGKALRHTAAVLPAVLAVICMWLARLDWHASVPHFALAAMLIIAVGT